MDFSEISFHALLPTTSLLHEFLFCFLLQLRMLDLICKVQDLSCEILAFNV